MTHHHLLLPPLGPAALLLAATALMATPVVAEEPAATAAFVTRVHKALRSKVDSANQRELKVLEGNDGWLFFVPELRTLSVGPFWGQHAQGVSRANNKRYADPLEPIVDFHSQLKAAGIRLLVVPVPAKCCVYPEQLDKDFAAPAGNTKKPTAPPRLDIHQQTFHRMLKRRGVEVVDLLPGFLAQRNDPRGPLYCKTDTHWSGRGAALAAATILENLDDPPWIKKLARLNSASLTTPVTITGDLARMINPDKPTPETLPLTFIGKIGKPNNRRRPIPTPISRNSPVLLIGDSHTLVFHDPTLHAAGAGLPDHIAAGLGIPVDLIGVRGSGATATRISLLRRRDNLKGKKLVIWCFSIREYTESFSGWRKVPVIRSR